MATTIKDVAEYAAVGVGTVSRVINDEKSVNDKTRKKVMDAIAALQYKPNRMASNLRKNKTRVIALLVPVINHPFFAKLAEYVNDEADRYEYSVLLVSSQRHEQKEREILERIRRREVDGAVFVTHFAHDENMLKDFPIVSIDRNFGENIPYVTSDNYDATAKAVEFLLSKGCERVGFIGSKPIVPSEVMERERAYADIMKKHGMPIRSVNEVVMHGDENSIVKKFLDKFGDADGVFVSGYTMAHELYEALAENGKHVPNDLQIVSYDGAFAQWSNRILTCVEQPIEQMGREVVRILMKKMDGEEVPERTMLKTSFIEGTTTK